MDFSTTVDIAAPPELVWQVMSDVERWPEWTASVRKIHKLTPGPLSVGSRVLIRQPRFPPALWVATEVEPGRRFTWTSGAPALRVLASHSIEPMGSGSRVTLALDYSGWLGRLLMRATRRITERYLGFEAAGLKRRSEALFGSSRGGRDGGA